ncbi:MAG: DUF4881 domain-containing protein [Desulfovibrio sp.]|jgi:hypothetical protein|nr:DUF4881 domain-containing protein [Desulfovibrio sp.]
MKIRTLLISVLALSFALAACDFNSGVEQGRAVAFDPATKTMTIVVDANRNSANPSYTGAVITYKLPVEAKEMGPKPLVGGLLKINLDKSLVIFDPVFNAPKEIAVEFTDVEKNIDSKHPKVAGKTFPLIDEEKERVTIYSSDLKALITFKPQRLLSPDVWADGDIMRVAFRNDDKIQAIRVMNVSKTDIFKR